ncbi:MAG: M67 family metallopeptidase [Planctomycetota bacterium]|jgi:proteasome lid subunit RPN8/RPN11
MLAVERARRAVLENAGALRQVFEQALPCEVCGWITAAGVHARTNAWREICPEQARRRYRWSRSDQLALARAYDKGGGLLALFHSHPRSPAWPSASDRRGARLFDHPVYPRLPRVVIGRSEGEELAFCIWTPEALDSVHGPWSLPGISLGELGGRLVS